VMPGSVLVVFGGLGVMLDVGVVAHRALPGYGSKSVWFTQAP
jgi:hypothetical protein